MKHQETSKNTEDYQGAETPKKIMSPEEQLAEDKNQNQNGWTNGSTQSRSPAVKKGKIYSNCLIFYHCISIVIHVVFIALYLYLHLNLYLCICILIYVSH